MKLRWMLLLVLGVLASDIRVGVAAQIAANNIPFGFVSAGTAYYVGNVSEEVNFTNEAAGQRFVAQRGGRLLEVAATIDTFVPGNEPLLVEIYSAAGDFPGAMLGGLSVPPQLVGDFSEQPSTFDFSTQNIQIVAGSSYVVAFRVEHPSAVNVLYRALQKLPNAAADFGIPSIYSPDFGATWLTTPNDRELGLIVTVPEPAAWTICLTGLLLLGASGLRSRGGYLCRQRGDCGA